MDHKVINVQQLHDDSSMLYDDVVVKIGDEQIINDLFQSIQILKNCWEGKDAGIQIQNIIDVYNGMVKIRNSYVELAKFTSKIASNYRELQNAGRANFEPLTPINGDSKNSTEGYSDNRDTISITSEAATAKDKVDSANTNIETFISNVTNYYNSIMDNWLEGPGRNEMISSFEDVISDSNKYRNTLNEASQSIATALKNYNDFKVNM